jgi:hypothetical protein
VVAPIGVKLEDFVQQLLRDGRAYGSVKAIVGGLSAWREKIEFALECYDENKHWDWHSYLDQIVFRLDSEFHGDGWRRKSIPDPC